MTAFVIDDDRKSEKGRLVAVWRVADGKTIEQWLNESVIQAAAQEAKLTAPSTGDLQLAPHDLKAQMGKRRRVAAPTPFADPRPQ
jgi:hypothetical protein